MQPTPPFWFHQRQAKMEAAGENTYQLKAPNLEAAFILVRRAADGGWQGVFRRQAEGPDAVTTVRSYDREADAWQAAFELFREQMVI